MTWQEYHSLSKDDEIDMFIDFIKRSRIDFDSNAELRKNVKDFVFFHYGVDPRTLKVIDRNGNPVDCEEKHRRNLAELAFLYWRNIDNAPGLVAWDYRNKIVDDDEPLTEEEVEEGYIHESEYVEYAYELIWDNLS